MHVAVTGAHGFVGLNVTRELAAQGHSVIAISRRDPDQWVERFLDDVDSVDHLIADVSEPGALAEALSSYSLNAVIHAAAVTGTTVQVERDEAARIVHVNTGGTIEALEAARLRGASRFIYVSSPSAIGVVSANTDMNEAIEKRPASLYGITKDIGEEITRRFGWLHDLPVASVRIGQPYGPGERTTTSRVRTSPIFEWIRDAEAGRELVTGPLNQARDWTYIDETARGIATLVTSDNLQHDLYHLGWENRITVGEVVEQIMKVYPDIRCDQDPPPDTLNPNIAGPGVRIPLNNSRFRDEFGWAPEIKIEEGISRYLDWWKAFLPNRSD